MTKRTIRSESHACFRSMADAGQFIRNLNANPPDEMKWFLLLQMYMPSEPMQLLEARWCDFNFQLGHWTIANRKNLRNSHILFSLPIAFLSSGAINVLADLKRYSGNGDLLFPNLAAMKKADRDRALTEYFQSNWPFYLVDLNCFRYFFQKVATKGSHFKPAFIDGAMKNVGKNLSPSYILQRRALVECWAIELMGSYSNL